MVHWIVRTIAIIGAHFFRPLQVWREGNQDGQKAQKDLIAFFAIHALCASFFTIPSQDFQIRRNFFAAKKALWWTLQITNNAPYSRVFFLADYPLHIV